MKTHRFPTLKFLALVLILTARLANGEEATQKVTLKPGDPAPKLYVSKWLNGAPVTAFEKDKVYVIECWATWCGPCMAVMPHVSELNTKYKGKGVVFIGLNVFERDMEGVEPVVQKMGKKLNYRVAIDELNGESGKSAEAWMRAAGRMGIPCTFIVDKQGMLAWIGHPARMEPILTQVVDGTFDYKKYAELEARIKVLQEKFQDAMDGKDPEAKLKTMDDLIAIKPDMAPYLEPARFKILLLEKKDYVLAYKVGDALADGNLSDDSNALNEISWTVLDSPGIEKRDFDLALKWILKADALTKHSDGPILDTLARAYFEKGLLDKALEVQTLAVEKSPENKGIAETLDKYKKLKAEELEKKAAEAQKKIEDAKKAPAVTTPK